MVAVFRTAVAALRAHGARASRLRQFGRSVLAAQRAGPRDVLSRRPRSRGFVAGPPRRPLARRLGRRRTCGAQLRAHREPHPDCARRHSRQRHSGRRRLHLVARRSGVQSCARSCTCRRTVEDFAAGRRRTRHRAAEQARQRKVRLGAAPVQSRSGEMAASHHACRRMSSGARRTGFSPPPGRDCGPSACPARRCR